ncbi:hypothetical protein GYMLUDRAFT_323093 [Collybiopsis luxurians FD-317 M1]|nr:hypothetical protein GYMLUDRAFT_323093 [Collybiopsis luxurians FD-317 M1]
MSVDLISAFLLSLLSLLSPLSSISFSSFSPSTCAYACIIESFLSSFLPFLFLPYILFFFQLLFSPDSSTLRSFI